MTRPILTTNDDLATIQVDVASARALGLTEDGVARLLLDAQAAAEVLARATDTRWTVERVESAEVTGETITDEQIKRLRRITLGQPEKSADDRRLIELCTVAVTDRRAMAFMMPGVAEGVARAREACAAAYNARLGVRP